MKVRHLLSLIAVIALLLGSGAPAMAQEGVQVNLNAPAEVETGSDFTARVDITQVVNFDAVQYDLSFDSSVLRLDDVTSGLVDTTEIAVNLWVEVSPGTYRIIQNIPGVPGTSGSGYLAILHFHVVGSASNRSDINLSRGFCNDYLAQEITATWIGDSVIVQPPGTLVKTSPKDLPVKLPPQQSSADGQSSTDGKPSGPKGKGNKPDGAPAANKWALLVGIADYEGRTNDLWHPDEDAKEMKVALVEKYGFPKENIKLLLNRKATAAAISNAIEWLVAREDAESTVVVMFSGHGYRAPDNDWNNDGVVDDGWDADVESDGYDEVVVSHDMYGLPDGWLKTKFTQIESRKFGLIFLGCYSGGMLDDAVVDLKEPGRVIVSACKADQLALDYLLLDNTICGYYLVDQGFLQGLAETDEPADGVSLEEGHAYAYPLLVVEQPDSEPNIYDGFTQELIP